MASLKEIRRRIQSIDNIKQITKSMEMIAAARFQRAQLKAHQSSKYIKEMRQIVSHLIAIKAEKIYPLLMPGKGTRTAIVVAGADRGLCGAYNSNLFNALDSFLKKFQPDKVELILLGNKAIEYYSRRKWPIALSIPEWGGKIKLQAITQIANDLIDKFLAGSYAAVRLVYTQHLTIFSRKVVNIPLLPIEIPIEVEFVNRDYIFEPQIEELFDTLLPLYCSAEIHQMLSQAYASELAARVCAMRAASQNAQEIKEKLTLERNKLRQTSITKEVLEISLGAQVQ